MELVDDGRDDGARRRPRLAAGRPSMRGHHRPLDERRIYYYLLWPIDVPVDPPGLPARPPARAAGPGPHPDRLRLAVRGRRRSRRPGFDPSDAVAFWDLTNRQDWHVCELQQRGTRSRSWVAGRYSNQEPSVHAFDLMVRRPLRRRRRSGASGPSASATTCRRRSPAPSPTDDAAASKSAARASARAKAVRRSLISSGTEGPMASGRIRRGDPRRQRRPARDRERLGWPAQAELERNVEAAFARHGVTVRRGHPVDPRHRPRLHLEPADGHGRLRRDRPRRAARSWPRRSGSTATTCSPGCAAIAGRS